MNVIIIIFAIYLHLTCLKKTHTNAHYVNNEHMDIDNPLENKYLIIVKKGKDINVNGKPDEGLEAKNEYYVLLDNYQKPVQRRFRDLQKDKEKRKQEELLKTQHARKVKEITEFMKENYMTTNYLYDEVNRIKRQRMVKDGLRKMVDYLEKPKKEKIREKIMKCYREARETEVIPHDIWGLETNNLVINVLKDPYNYGYIN